MIPSLVVTEIRSALVQYLATTFALSDDEVRDALSEFLTDNAEGIFRGPFLRVRTPFRQVDDRWPNPLDWLPDWFLPYLHQATAFERLSSVGGRQPQPTIVTTGTGSGKTECFLMPVLDHCRRMRADGHGGIKALILYPMNALASDQAGRIAELIAADRRLSGLRAGMFVGDVGRYSDMGPDHLIDKREVLRSDPPDILLTNYKMLDFLLLRREDRNLWAANQPDTLQYVVLDEFHSYDGAQGTDVAMLLRRLGATLGMATADAPLGTATPVATSATLGSGAGAKADLRAFASRVFGTEFDEASIIGETRKTIDEACDIVDYALPIPDVGDVIGLTELESVVAAFCVDPFGVEAAGDQAEPAPETPVELGAVLLKHPLTRAVLSAVGERSRSWREAVAEIVTRAPNWGRAYMTSPNEVELALAQYLWLLSEARRMEGERERPLFSVEIQLWIREVTRLLRATSTKPEFRWRDSASINDEDGARAVPGTELPAVYCRRCGTSGWMTFLPETSDTFSVNAARISTAALQRSPLIRTLMRAHPDDPDARFYSPSARRLLDSPTERAKAGDTFAVHVTAGDEEAKANNCPACGDRDAVRFLGLAVASLASVSINTLFGSPHVEDNERKLLAFTDSVQDASHRASFFGGRTHRINLRSLMSRVIVEHGIVENGSVNLADLGDLVFDEAETQRDRYGLIPPDLLMHPEVRTVWTDNPTETGVALLRSRLGFEADLEFGLRSRVGRTLELSRAAAARVQIDDLDPLVSLVGEVIEAETGQRPDAWSVAIYLRGLLERLRLRGGLLHPLLDPYLDDDGRQWRIWGGRPDGLPPFTPDQGRPSFFTTNPKGDLDSITAVSQTPTWVVNWAQRTLGQNPDGGVTLDAGKARDINVRALVLLASETDLIKSRRSTTSAGNAIYGLDRRSVVIDDLVDASGSPEPGAVRCNICGHIHAVAPAQLADWEGTPCLRYRCVGRFAALVPREQNYYRDLYRRGRTQRVVTAEHTGLLGRTAREDLERAFKDGTAPNAPNVITATPTLEMGIDIGDLSAVMLTSVPKNPASYIQRVGRAGRATGNSLVTTFVRTDTHGLYYLAEPEAMLAGEVRAPNCYLDASETLARQYVAYLIDRVADQSLEAPVLANQIDRLVTGTFDEGGFLRAIIDASTAEPGSDGRVSDGQSHVDRFLRLFGSHLAESTKDQLRAFARDGIEPMLRNAIGEWAQHKGDLELRRNRLRTAILKLEEELGPEAEPTPDLHGLRGQRRAIIDLLRRHRDEYTLSALERLGVLPNYTLVDDSVTLSATLWSRNTDGGYETKLLEYQRSGRLAVRELAPGNSFYAGGHRHFIDALEIGTADELRYETWRLCKECGFGTIEPAGEPPTVCPRCADTGIADMGARHTMLRLRQVLANSSEEGARVYDESDDRRQENYSMTTIVDVEPESVSGAWAMTEQTFGAELAGRTHIRTINLGYSDRRGEGPLPIAGQKPHVTRFNVCNHCGSVRETRDDRDGAKPEQLHQAWCRVRKDRAQEHWTPIVLFHELTTEAIRMLLPLSMFEVAERLASFKGALLLGLREDFGGDPEHLQVVLADSPNRTGQGRRRFLLLFDSVPGGTGYLARLADPDRLRRILEAGRQVIARCPCAGEGRQACHRCLLGVVDRRDYDLARRELALQLLDELLTNWSIEPVDTVAGIDIGKVEESELERRFKVALIDWARLASRDNEHIALQKVPGVGRYEAFELRLISGTGERARYRIAEQEGLTTTPSTQPDFLIQRMDAAAPEIAVYLDGFQFHASAENNNIADDARKRRAVRDSGRLVWNLTWDDVEVFHKAVTADPPREPGQRALLKNDARKVGRDLHNRMHGEFDLDAIDQNPMALLLDFLSRPHLDHWERLATSAVGGLFATAATKHPVAADELHGVLSTAALAVEPAWPTGVAGARFLAGRVTTSNDHSLTLLFDTERPIDERWTVVSALPDSADAIGATEHRLRWRDWTQWSNILQFLRSNGRAAFIAAASEAGDLHFSDLEAVAPPDEASDPNAISAEMADELSFVKDDDVKGLVTYALEQGCGDFVAGYEVAGEPLEAAWPEVKVAVLAAGKVGFGHDAWDARTAAEWTPDELIRTILERR